MNFSIGKDCISPFICRFYKRRWHPIVVLLAIIMGGHNQVVAVEDLSGAPDEIVAAVPRFSPPHYAVDNNGHPVGFVIDILEATAKQAGVSVEYRMYNSWSDIHQALIDGEVHIVPNMGVTTGEGEQFANLTSAVETFPISIAVRKDLPDLLMRLEDAAGVLLHSDRYDNIYMKWYTKPAAYWSGLPVLGLTFGLLVVLSTGFILWRYYSLRSANAQLRKESSLRRQAEQRLEQLNISRGTAQDITAKKSVERMLSLSQYALDHVSEAAFLVNSDGRFRYVNHSACTSLGYGREELLSLNLADITPSISSLSIPNRLESLKKVGTQRFETVHQRRDGLRFPVEIVADYLVFDDEEYVFAVARDISAIKSAQAEIERQHGLLQVVIDGMSDPILMIESNYNVRLMNKAARRSAPAFALAMAQPKCYQVSHHSREPCSGNDHPCPLRDVIASGKTQRVEHTHPSESGAERIYQILANPLFNSDGTITGIIESCRDVTEYRNLLEKLRENENRLAHIAHHDTLTGLPNRLLFVDRLQQAIIKARRAHSLIALMFIDLDRFKAVNDSFGHQVGDKLLNLASTRLRTHIREEDTAARLGGDEFTLILDNIDKTQDAGKVAEKLLLAFQQPFEIEDKKFFLTASIGISIYPQDGDDANTLIRNADSAMYNAKECGRNLFRYYTEEMTATALERVVMETNLRGALEREAFELYYQPQVDMRSGALVGVEALVRWNHPELGLLAPSRFIPMAEETGLILPIGEWILHQACQQARSWMEMGMNRNRISVNCNLSGQQIESELFHHTVVKVIEETGITPDLLELEITESSIMDDPQSSSRMLNKLCDIGVKLAIDDFGTGYSSLAYLKALPISTLKIDQSFVRDITADADDAAITRAVIALGSSLRMQVIAEGVETEEQANFLVSEGCHIGQGFLFAKPMPALEFEQYLLAWIEEPKKQIE